MNELMAFRRNRIDVAFQDLFPGDYTWSVTTDPRFVELFPCGFAPLGHTFGTTMAFNPDQVLRVSADLDHERFELFLDSIVMWFMSTGAAFVNETPADFILDIFAYKEPEAAQLLTELAESLGFSLLRFLGADQGRSPS